MTKYCEWCKGIKPKDLKLCSGCLMLSSKFIGTDIRPFLSEKRNKTINRYLGPGRGLKVEQRIRHLTQEIDIPINIPPILRSKRKNSVAHWAYDASEWDELVDYWRRFQRLRPGNYIFPDGSSMSIETNENIFINSFMVDRGLPVLDIAEWLSNPLRINSIKDWGDFMLLLDCIATRLPDISNEERWADWIEENSWRGLDYPFSVPVGNYVNQHRLPPFLEFIERKYRRLEDTRTSSDVIRENIDNMDREKYGLIGESWVNIYYQNNAYDDEYDTKSIPILVIQNHRLKILVISDNKPAAYSIGNDPRDWRKLMVCALLPNRSPGSEFIQGLFMNWTEENCLWEPSLRQIRSARLLHDEIEKLDNKSSLIPVDYSSQNSGILVVGNSGMTYVISPSDNKIKVDAVQGISRINDSELEGIDICIDPLIIDDLPFGDFAVGYLLALSNDTESRHQIFTLDFFLKAIDENKDLVSNENYWDTVGHDFHQGLESMHDFLGEQMDEDMEMRIAEFENEQEMLRQQEEFEQQKESDRKDAEIAEKAEMDLEQRQFEDFLERMEQSGHGDYCE